MLKCECCGKDAFSLEDFLEDLRDNGVDVEEYLKVMDYRYEDYLGVLSCIHCNTITYI